LFYAQILLFPVPKLLLDAQVLCHVHNLVVFNKLPLYYVPDLFVVWEWTFLELLFSMCHFSLLHMHNLVRFLSMLLVHHAISFRYLKMSISAKLAFHVENFAISRA
jgi:hypothetical protein